MGHGIQDLINRKHSTGSITDTDSSLSSISSTKLDDLQATEVQPTQSPASPKKRSRSEMDADTEQDSPKKDAKRGKKAAAPPAPARTSTRSRKAPARFSDEQQADADAGKKPVAPRAAGSKTFDPVWITTASKSRLVSCDVYHLLLESTAWKCLSAGQKASLINMLPPTTKNGNALAAIDADVTEIQRPKELAACEIFCTDVAKFQTDLAAGQLTKTWQAVAEQAMIDRAAGAFEGWKERETEIWWGQNTE